MNEWACESHTSFNLEVGSFSIGLLLREALVLPIGSKPKSQHKTQAPQAPEASDFCQKIINKDFLCL